MTTVSYTPRNWHGTDSAPNAPEEVRLRTAVQTAITSIDGEISALETRQSYGTQFVVLAAGSTATSYIVQPTARTISAIDVKTGGGTFAVGTFTLSVADGDGTTLLSTATADVAAVTTSFSALTLTATTANLALAAGEPVRLQLVSNSGGASGGPLIVRITYTD